VALLATGELTIIAVIGCLARYRRGFDGVGGMSRSVALLATGELLIIAGSLSVALLAAEEF
jgi:hypothetical protein